MCLTQTCRHVVTIAHGTTLRVAVAQKGAMLVKSGPQTTRLLPLGRVCAILLLASVSKRSRRAECSVDPLVSLSSCDRPTWNKSQEVRTTPMFTNRLLVCRDCQQEFVFTTGEQEFYESRGLTNAPSRCPACRAEHKAQGETRSWSRSERTGVRSERPMYAATCANCGRETQVPFQPRTDRPVYCPDCYQDRRRDPRTRW